MLCRCLYVCWCALFFSLRFIPHHVSSFSAPWSAHAFFLISLSLVSIFASLSFVRPPRTERLKKREKRPIPLFLSHTFLFPPLIQCEWTEYRRHRCTSGHSSLADTLNPISSLYVLPLASSGGLALVNGLCTLWTVFLYEWAMATRGG
jgi:hypothetical protein